MRESTAARLFIFRALNARENRGRTSGARPNRNSSSSGGSGDGGGGSKLRSVIETSNGDPPSIGRIAGDATAATKRTILIREVTHAQRYV